jgi:hypothetical protein
MPTSSRWLLAVTMVGLLTAGVHFTVAGRSPETVDALAAQAAAEGDADPRSDSGDVDPATELGLTAVETSIGEMVVSEGPATTEDQRKLASVIAASAQYASASRQAHHDTGPVLRWSSSADRSNPAPLDGAELVGPVYAFLDIEGAVAEVRFWIDDPSRTGGPSQVERNAPFDVAGGSLSDSKPLRLSDGDHSVTAEVRFDDGSTVVTTASFTVSSGGSSTTTIAEGEALAGSSTATTTHATTTTTKATTTTTTKATTTTTAASGSSTKAPAGSIVLRPGDNVSAKVDGAPTGATFWFTAGTYKGVSVKPKSGQTFIGEKGAILDGGGKAYAFRSGASNVTIEGLVIERYRPGSKEAAIHPEGAQNWLVRSNEIRYNGEIGVKAYHGWRIIGNNIHHNGRYGVQGSGDGILVEGNEIAYNSTDYGATGESGGTKFVNTTKLVLRNNHVHHNYGNGLWVDINNVNALIEGNAVIANYKAGINLEISCGGTIRNNRVEGNSFKDPHASWMSGSAILVSNTPNVTVTGNRLSGNAKGIGAIHWDHPNRKSVKACSPELRNLKVTGNTIAQKTGPAAGLDAKINTDQVWSSWGNTFANNTYQLSGDSRFRWGGGWVSFEEWKAAGNG